MKLILAVGNPGDRYRDTRHNAGWWLADHLVSSWGLAPYRVDGSRIWTEGQVGGETLRVVRPLTYVNRSGFVLLPVIGDPDFRADRDLLVLVDDVALEPGCFRLRARGSAGGHRGLSSIEESLSSREYARLRIGVGRPSDDRVDLADYVLAAPPPFEEEEILEAFPRLVDVVESWITAGIQHALNRLNNS